MRINLFGLSGGKDSTFLAGWAIHESGYPIDSLVFSFCDTENEYDEVYAQIRAIDAYIQRHGCKPVVWLRAKGAWVDKFCMFPLFLALALWKKRFPSAKARFCTQFLKIKPTEELIKSFIAQGHEVVSHSGVRASESIERSLLNEWGKDMFGGEDVDHAWKWLSEWKNARSVPHNVWIGVSVEDQERADERIPLLLQIPARVRFLSVEPMLGRIDFEFPQPYPSGEWCYGSGKNDVGFPAMEYPKPDIHWAIFGGESGKGARPCNIEWIRDGVKQCRAAGVKVFCKPTWQRMGKLGDPRQKRRLNGCMAGGFAGEGVSKLTV